MSNRAWFVILRIVATGAFPALAVLSQAYPHDVWFSASIAALGAIAVHVIPVRGQR